MSVRSVVLFLFLCLFSLLVTAQNNSTSATASDTQQPKAGWKGGPTQRGTLMLVYSCLSAVFASTWTVLHLNVPAPSEGAWTRGLRKAKWMAITILFPEFVFSKAVCELRLAVADLYEMHIELERRKMKWESTEKHGGTIYKMMWSWEAEFSSPMKRLYRLLGLPRLQENMVPAVEEQSQVSLSSSGEIDGSIPAARLKREQHNGDAVLDPRAMDEVRNSQGGVEDVEKGLGTIFFQPGLGHNKKLEPTEVLEFQGADELQIGNSGGTMERQDSVGAISAIQGGPSVLSPEIKPTIQLGETARRSSSTSRGSNRPSSQHAVQSEIIESMNQPNYAEYREADFTWEQPRTWTLVHSFYANMGGILYYLEDEEQPMAFAATTNSIVFQSKQNLPCPLEELILEKKDIEDKSKVDWLLKAIAVSQITWLILNIAARVAAKLPITQLEIATAAFSLMAIVTYMANWWKPKDVVTPTVLRRPNCLVDDLEHTRSFRSFFKSLQAPSSWNEVFHLVCRRQIHNDNIWMQGDTPLIWGLMAISSLAFGGFHCLAWKFDFPSNIELILWRIVSLASAILPSVALGINLSLKFLSTTVVDNMATSHLLAALAPLEQFPPAWWDLVKSKPEFLGWKWESWFTFRSTPGTRNWDIAPPCLADPPPEAKQIARDDLEALDRQWTFLCNFLDIWPQLKERKKRWNLWTDVRRIFMSLHTTVLSFHSSETPLFWTRQMAPSLWREYEEHLKMTKLDIVTRGRLTMGCLDSFFDVLPMVLDLMKRTGRLKQNYDQVSTVIMIGISILYGISRLTLLVLLFTSLRSVPEGVYENTPWTRFLPSIS
jgi:hypothetical protein